MFKLKLLIILSGVLGGIQHLAALEISKHENDHARLNAIYLSGVIEEGDTYKLKLYISELTKKKNIAVYLDSMGGNLLEGIELGRFFRNKQIKTVIENEKICASACALAFLGGFNKNTGLPWRTKTSTAKLGFHTFYNQFDEKTVFSVNKTKILIRLSQLIILDMISYFEEMNVDSKLLKETLLTNEDEMYWVSNSEALDYGFHIWDTETEKLINADKFLSILK